MDGRGFSDARRRNASIAIFLGLASLFLVSEKVIGAGDLSFDWTNTILSWQRTAFHFQPSKNWMNDPNGPFYYNGWYHLFYQYNPNAAVWGNITWGHAVSTDLIHWFHLPNALLPDQPYDVNGVWTGSATILPDGRIIMLYTGLLNETSQVQCLAFPANLSDPFLLEWVKHPDNPVLTPPPGIGKSDFRDPSTAWLTPDGDKWRIVIGSMVNKTGIALVYETSDFVDYELLDGYLHAVPGTGMWECIDFYPVAVDSEYGSDTSANGPGIKHVMKVSVYDDNHDYYALGTYDAELNQWTPDDPSLEVGISLRNDYGEYYASKSFYDQKTKRRILWGWVKETDAERADIIKGWASVLTIPRTVLLDRKTRANLIQWPVEEVESLRGESFEINNVMLEPGSTVPLLIDSASELDIEAVFEIEGDDAEVVEGVDSSYNCTSSGGASSRGLLGPFGIVLLATKELSELTPIYFYIAKQSNGDMDYHFCADELRSSKALDVNRQVYGSSVPVLKGEKLTIRSLVDHSIVESFAQGGRRVITVRVYPTQVVDAPSEILLFNNATGARVRASVKMWNMKSAGIRDLFCVDQAL